MLALGKYPPFTVAAMLACTPCRALEDPRGGFVGAVVAAHDRSWRIRALRRESESANRPSGGISVQALSIVDALLQGLTEAAAEIGDPAITTKVERMVAERSRVVPDRGRMAFGPLLAADEKGACRLRCPYCRTSYEVLESKLQEQLWPRRNLFVAPGSRRPALEVWLDNAREDATVSIRPRRAPGVPLRPVKRGLQGARTVSRNSL